MASFIFGGFPADTSSVKLAIENNPNSISAEKMREEVAVFEASRLQLKIETIVVNLGGSGRTLLPVAKNLAAIAEYLAGANVSW